jgi:hypothetical protein
VPAEAITAGNERNGSIGRRRTVCDIGYRSGRLPNGFNARPAATGFFYQLKNFW